jgi:hypothetical protein
MLAQASSLVPFIYLAQAWTLALSDGYAMVLS